MSDEDSSMIGGGGENGLVEKEFCTNSNVQVDRSQQSLFFPSGTVHSYGLEEPTVQLWTGNQYSYVIKRPYEVKQW